MTSEEIHNSILAHGIAVDEGSDTNHRCNVHDGELEGVTITNKNLTDAVFKYVKFNRVEFNNCTIDHSAFLMCEFVLCRFADCHIHSTTFCGSLFVTSDFVGCSLNHSKFNGATFRRCLAQFAGCSLVMCDFSECEGLLDPAQWLLNNLEHGPEGVYAYKAFGLYQQINPSWKIKPNHIITEAVNFDRTSDCGSGVNVATREWLRKVVQSRIDGCYGNTTVYGTKPGYWKVLIPWNAIASVCVPYGTDGKFRAGKVQLVEFYEWDTLVELRKDAA